MRKKWYLNTWVICLLLAPTILGFAVPALLLLPVTGIVLAVLQYKYDKELFDKYGSLNTLETKIALLDNEFNIKNQNLQKEFDKKHKIYKVILIKFQKISKIVTITD